MSVTSRVRLVITASLLAGGVFSTRAAEVTSQCRIVGPNNPPPQPGDYLATAYHDELKRTLSPRAARKTTTLPFARVAREDAGLSMAVGTFEEGAGEVVLSDSGVARPGYPDGACTVVLSDTSHFSLATGSHTPLAQYTRIGDLDLWVSDVLFVGRYTDKEGRIYVFERDGTAAFDGKPIRYSISEPEGYGFEDGNIMIGGQHFRFERTQKALKLYGPFNGAGPAPSNPMYALKVAAVVR